MRTRRLGATDLELTTVGLGTWAIGGPWAFGWGPQSDSDSLATIRRALDLGINWIDTAPAYGLGHAETIVGQAIAGRSERVIIATKCGLVWDDPSTRTVDHRLTADSVIAEAEASLRRLGVETIDLYQIHWPVPDEQIEEAWRAIDSLVRSGKVRHAGVSNFSTAQLDRVRAIAPVASLQPPLSLLDRAAESALLPYCVDQDIGVVAYGAMAYGLLTGKFSQAALAALPADDWRRQGGRFREPELSANLEFVEGLKPLATQQGRPLSHLALAWVLQRPGVTATIVGARDPQQIEQTAAAGDWELPDDTRAVIDALLARRAKRLGTYRPKVPV
ncbi:aldo/keto reductase [Methylotetracoccus oryzae]|uniref:aldo/keto reductase n=1 Tax=Methylotetracoccus oryzae TaxID=1919059 RepID=UPI00111A9069|nr:aldo/keto reductase [Methylotetracoccus oryzae]